MFTIPYSMSLVAFDLDNTLGFFDVVGPWGEFFSVDLLENSVNTLKNPGQIFSPTLKRRLRKVEAAVLKAIRGNPEILEMIIRPNLDALLLPIIQAKRKGKVTAVCIYSNTPNTYSMYLAKALIEDIYEYPGFFDCMVDATQELRADDWKRKEKGSSEPLKTLSTLRCIFKDLCGIKGTIRPDQVLFVDERLKKHALEIEEARGLTYLKPTVYSPPVSKALKEKCFETILLAIDGTGLFEDKEYLESGILNCVKYDLLSKSTVKIEDIFELLKYVEDMAEHPWVAPTEFKDDSKAIRQTVLKFLANR